MVSPVQKDLIERFGVLHERMGLRPAAGRILGLLLVSTEPDLTFDEIRETLGLSKSATSTNLQHLQDTGSVEYRTRPGDRRRYFRKAFDDWENGFLQRVYGYLKIRDLLVEAATLRGSVDPPSVEAMDRMIDFLAQFETATRAFQQNWQHGSQGNT